MLDIYTLVTLDSEFSWADVMGLGVFPDFSISFTHYCSYVFLRLKTRYRILFQFQ
jgi:hypothetical protein